MQLANTQLYFFIFLNTGGGRAVYRVEISIDGGHTWEPVDKMEQKPDKKSGMYWAWALWEKTVPRMNKSTEIIARACKFCLYVLEYMYVIQVYPTLFLTVFFIFFYAIRRFERKCSARIPYLELPWSHEQCMV
jgi:hypothetical protein